MQSTLIGFLLLFICSGRLCDSEAKFTDFQKILDDKCGQCHTRLRIEDAIQRGADMQLIIAKMNRLGARLSQQEQQVMGVFWSPEAAQIAAEPVAPDDPLREYRAVLQSRCSGCHSLQIVEKALSEGQPISNLIDIMRKRGAIITEGDKKILGTFWGNPLKTTP